MVGLEAKEKLGAETVPFGDNKGKDGVPAKDGGHINELIGISSPSHC